jgi:hypothetical protein
MLGDCCRLFICMIEVPIRSEMLHAELWVIVSHSALSKDGQSSVGKYRHLQQQYPLWLLSGCHVA